MKDYFIPGNVPSSKNSKIWTGRFLVWSKAAQKYVKNTKKYWEDNKEEFRNCFDACTLPVKVKFKYIRGTKHKFDYVNPLQTSLDLMVTHGWIPDDNADVILPVFEQYEYDKENPGVFITIIN